MSEWREINGVAVLPDTYTIDEDGAVRMRRYKTDSDWYERNPDVLTKTRLRKERHLRPAKDQPVCCRILYNGSTWTDLYDARLAVEDKISPEEREAAAAYRKKRREWLRTVEKCPRCGGFNAYHRSNLHAIELEVTWDFEFGHRPLKQLIDYDASRIAPMCDRCEQAAYQKAAETYHNRDNPEPVPAEKSRPKVVVFDCETTGLHPDQDDEMLSLGFCDLEENEVWYSLLHPLKNSSWNDAERINGISPRRVANSPSIEECREVVQGVIDSAEILIGYNVDFDHGFLEAAGFNLEGKTFIDVMIPFAEAYGEWNDYFQDYKWQKLTTAAAHIGYEWKGSAHGALADAQATAAVYKWLQAQ